MNALNEVNKVIASVTYYPHRHTGLEEEEWLTAERMAVSNGICCGLRLWPACCCFVNSRHVQVSIFFRSGKEEEYLC
jgi:hypothetical protein